MLLNELFSDTHKLSFDIQSVKAAAAGRWAEILSRLGNVAPELLDGRNHPCPKCGGKDRFRLIDEDAGALLCNQCFSEKNGDGFAALGWLTGCSFPEAVKMVSDHVGANPGGNGRGHSDKADKSSQLAANIAKLQGADKNHPSYRQLVDDFCLAKPPITVDGVEKTGGRIVHGCGQACIRVDGYKAIGDSEPGATVLLRADGQSFPPIGSLAERKSHTLGGSRNSWITAGDVQTASTIIDVEGLPDLMAAASMLPDGWAATTNTAGAKARGKLSRKWAKGKQIIAVGDSDQPGQEGQRRAAAAYLAAGAEVMVAQLPYPIEKTHGRDLRDWLNEGNKLEDLPAEPVADKWARQIVVDIDEARIIDEAVEALAARDDIYQRGSSLVHIVSSSKPPKGISRPAESPRIVPVREPRIQELLADSARWLAPSEEDGLKQVHPPRWAVKGVVARDQWPKIRRLEAIVESPVLRADGTVLQEPGYDPSTGIFLKPSCAYPEIPARPTHDRAVAACDVLLEVVVDFPFANDSHCAAWLAGVLTPIARYAYCGPAPLFLNDANVRGCGKSLLTDASSLITTGRAMARMTLPRDDDELRKRITALAVAGEPLILIDNIAGTFGSASLDAALTATSWSDRILGQTTIATLPLYATWYATGNNVILAADTSRRVVHIRLESPEESPEERTGFRHADLLGWVRQNRPRLTMAAVEILSAYCHAGRPDMRLTPWGSFEGWSDLVRQAVVWAGMEDPGTSRTDLTSQSDREAMALRQLITGWEEIDPSSSGMTVAAVVRELAEQPDLYEGLRAALFELAPPRDGRTLNPRSIGMKLHHLRRRVVGGRFLDRRTTNMGAMWLVCSGDTRGTKGTKGTTPRHARARAHTRARNFTGTENSPTSPSSPTAINPCPHTNVAEEPTFDGYINRTCRDCGKTLGCKKQEQSA